MWAENEKWIVGQTILTRYHKKCSWKYYIGIINKTDHKNKVYEIDYFTKNKQKYGLLLFTKPKRKDVDGNALEHIIVKSIDMLQISETPEQFILMDDEDLSYF